jgi:patatin-like phospholipase
MRRLFHDIFYSFPIQLFILHFRKYQLLLLFWLLLISTIDSSFMKAYGADALFFVPEYLGNVGALSAAIIGVSMGVFFMSWNITTFILHSKRFKFLASTSKPFLKYCINNALFPLILLVFYIVRLYWFDTHRELLGKLQIVYLIAGFFGGLILHVAFSFAYFFSADRRILQKIAPTIADPKSFKSNYDPSLRPQKDGFGLKVHSYFSTRLKIRKVRNVSHYSEDFLDTIFKRHHFAGMLGIILAFIFLVTVGFFLDVKMFQIPAAASIIIFSAVMIAVIGALSFFLQSWSVPVFIVTVIVLNILFSNEVIDPRNKAYGINYTNSDERPEYTKEHLQQLCTPGKIAADKANMLHILENWKKKQSSDKPVMVFINVSGGGLRSAAFVMNSLQRLDSITNGELMKHTFLISGASGGMLAATYYRELYLRKSKGAAIDIYTHQYEDNITQDLLNPIFSSMIDRDIFAPAQKFSVGQYKYIKDRGYAFEQKLNENSGGLLGKQLKDYTADEYAANIPLMFFNSVITRDGRKVVVGTQPLSFMMKPAALDNDSTASPDAMDFDAMFAKQDPKDLRLLTALRMNATFPYVLPNVWLPTNPIVDVMDAGLRDNFGQETTLRFVDNFKDWIAKNTSGIIIVEIRDRPNDNWQLPLVTGSISDVLIKPVTMLQHNWYKLQDFYQADQYDYYNDSSMHKLSFLYIPKNEEEGAALNFHLTAAEKKDVIAAFDLPYNQRVLKTLLRLLK